MVLIDSHVSIRSPREDAMMSTNSVASHLCTIFWITGHSTLQTMSYLPLWCSLIVEKGLMLSPFPSIATGKSISKKSLNHLYSAAP